MNKIKSIFLCGVLTLSSCNLMTLPEYNGIVLQGTAEEQRSMQLMINHVRDMNEYGDYLISQAESHGILIKLNPNLNVNGLYYPDKNEIILRGINAKTLAHEINHMLQSEKGMFYKILNMTSSEYDLMCLYAEFDASYKAICFEQYDKLNTYTTLQNPNVLYRDYYIDYTIKSLNYEFLLNYYNDKLGADKYNPSDLMNNVDKTFFDYDEEYVLTKLNENIKGE